MTVEEYISTNSCNIKLGANDGGAFVYCGNTDNINVEQLDRHIKAVYKKTKENAANRIQRLKNKSFEDWCFLMERRGYTNPTIAEFKTMIKNEIEVARRTKRDFTERINSYTSIGNRNIIETYDSIDEDNVKIVIYEGRERGVAWTTEEYVNGYEE